MAASSAVPFCSVARVLGAAVVRGGRFDDGDAEHALVVEPLRLEPDPELVRRLVAGEDVAEEAAPQPPPHPELVLAAQEVERHELLQEQQRGAGELRRPGAGARGGQHPLGAAHDEHVAEEDPLAGVGDGPAGVGRTERRLVRPPEARREVGSIGRAPRARDDAAARVEEHDGHVEDRRHPLDQLADVLLPDDELEQLDLERGRATQRLHVARREGPGPAGVRRPVQQGRLEGLRVQPHLVLQHDRRLEQAEVGAVDVHARLRPVHERVDDLVEPGDLGLECLHVAGRLLLVRHARPPRRGRPAASRARSPSGSG